MSYHFKAGDKSAQAAVRRVALSQIEAVIDELDSAALSREQVVHQVRKRCKKLRALLRLVRPGLAGYVTENAAFRDLARTLGGMRDQDVLIETCDKLATHFGKDAEPEAFAAARSRLATEKRDRPDGALDDKLAAFRQGMVEARERTKFWVIEGDDFSAFSGGLRLTLKRAERAMLQARADPAPDIMHEWRKRVKYHWYHARLLHDIWPAAMQAHIAAASNLADLLGDHHDLAVLRQRLTERPEDYGGEEAVRLVASLAGRREEDLTDEIFRKGALLLAERPKVLARRWERYWQLWRGES